MLQMLHHSAFFDKRSPSYWGGKVSQAFLPCAVQLMPVITKDRAEPSKMNCFNIPSTRSFSQLNCGPCDTEFCTRASLSVA